MQKSLTPQQLKALRAESPGEVRNRIAIACRIAEVTQMDISRATGMSPQRVSDVANGRFGDVRVGTARKFSAFFGCAIEDLFPSCEAAA